MYAQSMQSKIRIDQEIQAHRQIRLQNQLLTDASQLDELTGLYNRRYFNKLISKVTHNELVRRIGFIMLDVDSFKQYNDFYGHFKGDDALRTIARILSQCAAEGIYVSRYGGDEFVCLCVDQTDADIENYMESVIAKLTQDNIPHIKGLYSKILMVSMGYSNQVYQEGMDTEDLLHLADQALYEVKALKKRNMH